MPTKKPATKKATKKTTKVKKVAKKATKKVAKKATAKKASTKKPLLHASDDTSFWVSDGQILNSLLALRDSLNQMSKEVYQYHAGGKQNDFANWVEVVLCDEQCAHDLRKAKTPHSAKTVVVKHLKYYAV
jgi:hypothetical protein